MPRLAVLGQPVSHSRSPAMHNAALAELGLAPEWAYEAIEVAPESFADLVASLPVQGFAGVNVTVPHKLAALALADAASDAAAAIGAANTLTFRDGRIEAENTDATGIVAALPGSLEGLRALVLGAGGSARAAIWGLREAGARVSVWNRTAARAEALATELGADLAKGDREAVDPGRFDLILNATTVGMEDTNPGTPEAPLPPGGGPAALKALPVAADSIRAEHTVVDLVYGTRETELIRAARAAGASCVDGIDVLACQGAASLRLWTGLEPPLETMRGAARTGRT